MEFASKFANYHDSVTRAEVRQTQHAPAQHPHTPLRLEIQALRAVAVGVVVLYHFWPTYLPGGYIGVDVFFVISGYLITSHLLREVEIRGRVRLANFWARRLRRLLPAAMLVLAVVLLATLWWLPSARWPQTLREVIGSTFYVENWVLAFDSVDYLGAGNTKSPVQHYWSLSVEEQFYLVWPLLFVAIALLARWRKWSGRRVAIVVMSVVVVGGLAFSIWATGYSKAAAYFITPTRVWEFAAGGLFAALAPQALRIPNWLRSVMSLLGLITIGVTALLYSSATPFPGSAALLPVLASLLVIGAGMPEGRWGLGPLLRWRPVQWVGDVSYSIYLWHWPLLILIPFGLDLELDLPLRLGILALSLVLAWISKVLVEDPYRSWGWLTARSSAVSFAFAGLMMAVIAVPVVIGQAQLQQRADSMQQAMVELDQLGLADCIGFGAVDPANTGLCDPTLFEEAPIFPDRAKMLTDIPAIYSDQCRSQPDDPKLRICEFGDTESDDVVMLLGDSHAAAYFDGLERAANRYGWKLVTAFKGGCPYTKVDQNLGASCRTFNEALRKWVLDERHIPDVVVTSMLLDRDWGFKGGNDWAALAKRTGETWKEFTDAGIHVVVMDDTPKMSQRAVECVVNAKRDEKALGCATPRKQAIVGESVLPEAARVANATFVPLRTYLCGASQCPVIVGNVIAYRDDSSHLTATFSASLAQRIAREILPRLLGTAGDLDADGSRFGADVADSIVQ